MKDKQFLAWYVLGISVFLCTIICIAYIGNPGEAFHPDPKINERAYDSIYNLGYIVSPDNPTDRLFFKSVVRQDNVTRDIIVLGSSRIMKLEGEMVVPHLKNIAPQMEKSLQSRGATEVWYLNHGVIMASLEDHLAVLGMYIEKGYIPEMVIFGLDPWIFNENNGSNLWRDVDIDYYRFLDQLDYQRSYEQTLLYQSIIKSYHGLLRYFSAVSYPMISESIKNILRNILIQYTVSGGSPMGNKTSDAPTPPSVREVDMQARKEAANLPGYYGFGSFHEISPRLKQQFESTIAFLEMNGVSVVFVLTPYHPIMYSAISHDPSYARVLETEEYLEEYAIAHNIPLCGSYNPGKFRFTSKDFQDGTHPKEEAMKFLIEKCSSHSSYFQSSLRQRVLNIIDN
ncbi:MAG: hypothetical protein LBV40_07820 [Methanomicrobiales archaeon]|jgi:hypothetical protein|nr:hypothetical protein [Methanomicrobiales archaeon]